MDKNEKYEQLWRHYIGKLVKDLGEQEEFKFKKDTLQEVINEMILLEKEQILDQPK